MNIQQTGLGNCQTCGNPIMQTINQPGRKGICFSCAADAEPKTGRTVVVKNETGETKASRNAPEGKVEIVDVTNVVEVTPEKVTVTTKRADTILLELTIDELYEPNILLTILKKINEGIDNMPPPPTIKESKRIFKLQDTIEKQIKDMEK